MSVTLTDINRRLTRIEKSDTLRPDAWLTVAEVMATMGWSRKTVYNNKGKFTTKKVGGLKFKKSELVEYSELRTQIKAA
jgi:predicted DNA-binding transcriptional regulator AlpA